MDQDERESDEMIFYQSPKDLNDLANEHYAGIKEIVESRLELVTELLTYVNTGITLQGSNLKDIKVLVIKSKTNIAGVYSVFSETHKSGNTYSDLIKSLKQKSLNVNRLYFVKDFKSNLKNIITSLPDNLLTESKKLNNTLCKFDNWSHNEDTKKIIEWILPYEDFRKSNNKFNWSAADLSNALNCPVCLYCNRQYITNYVHYNGRRFSGQFDHFYGKQDHPILRLSFYNLIPSCSICNTTLKPQYNMTNGLLLHPYLSGFDEKTPNIKFEIPSTFRTDIKADFKITIQADQANSEHIKIKNSIETFQLDSIYQVHKELVRDIYKKTEEINIMSLDSLRRTLKGSNANVDLSEEECYRLYFGTSLNKADYQKRPLSKFNKDIVESLGFNFNL